VTYVGRTDRGVYRRFRTKSGFERAVEKGNYDYLVIGRGREATLPPQAREEPWARAAGYKLMTRGPLTTLYERDPFAPLARVTCARRRVRRCS
jgi:hypothetical protein